LTALAVATAFIGAPVNAQGVRQGHGVFVPDGAREVPALATRPITFGISLPLTHTDRLDQLIKDVNDPSSPSFGHYLTPSEFAAQFGASQADYDATVKDLKSQGFNVTADSPTRTLIQVGGTAAQAEGLFKVHMKEYVAADGRNFHAPDMAPLVPTSLAVRGANVLGLNSGIKPHHVTGNPPSLLSNGFGDTNHTGLGAGPDDIRLAYGLAQSGLNGAGQNIGLYELDDYADSDVTLYETSYKLPATPLVRVQVKPTTLSSGQGEVTLDIDMMLALTPNASHIVVYETNLATATTNDLISLLQHMANDTTHPCREFSSSWGEAEDAATANFTDFSFPNAENQVYAQMAAQGQAFFVAAGDTGAFGNRSKPGVIMAADPMTQPFVTSVGGTTILVGLDDAYVSETTWSDPTNTGQSQSGSAGGGGISQIWPIPNYQQGIVSHAPAGEFSTTHRNFPDISLNADGRTGYEVALQGSGQVFGGTSAAAPLWCSYWAIVNQQRAAIGEPQIGFANPYLYRLAKGPDYGIDFHDINDNSTNLHYHAVTGYDTATGWGTINDNLINDLVFNDAAGTGNLLVLQNATTHQISQWHMANTSLVSAGLVTTTPPAGWNVVGTGDFNGDGHPELVLENQSTGAVQFWFLNGNNVIGTMNLSMAVPTGWTITGVGDFNGAGQPDLVLQNTATGHLAIWLINNFNVTGVSVATSPGTSFKEVGVGDFNGDGNSDLLFENPTTHQLVVWYMNGTTFASSGTFAVAPGAGFSLGAVSNLQGFGHPDLVFQKGTQAVVWDLNNTTLIGSGTIATSTGVGFNIVAPR